MTCIKHCKSKAFSLIELMVVIAIVAVMAAIAMPAYKNYIIRASAVEGTNLVDSLKKQQLQYYAEHGYFGQTSDLVDVTAEPYASKFIYLDVSSVFNNLGCDAFAITSEINLGSDSYNAPRSCRIYSQVYNLDGIIKETSCVAQQGNPSSDCASYFPKCVDMGDGSNTQPLLDMWDETCR